MHISKLSLVNYRNFRNTKLIFRKGTNTIIGENGSGKTNLFRAIRLLLDDHMVRSANRLAQYDFHRGLKQWKGHWIILSLEFEDVSQDEAVQSLFLHATGNITAGNVGKSTYNLIFRPKLAVRRQLSLLARGDHVGLAKILDGISIDDYETVFTGRSEADFNDEQLYRQIVGDFENVVFDAELDFPELGSRPSSMLSLAKEFSFTYIQALRDVVLEFQNNRTNPLFTLLKRKSGEIDKEKFKPISEQVTKINQAIGALPDVQSVSRDIRRTIKDAAGEAYSPTALSIRSALSDEAEELFRSLKLYVGESEEGYEGGINELSLGGANLIYLTLKLLEFKYQKERQAVANFLLIEEPEAHIHTHIQKTLFDRLNFSDTQIIYSTHSTHISEVCNVQSMNILGRHHAVCEAYQPATGLGPIEVRNIQRYLDAVRSNLLFAKSVILVEGDAEEILIPILVKSVLDVSLDELGISLINIRSTGFKNVAVLFHDQRIRRKCSIVTDLDAAIVDTTPAAGDPETSKNFKAACARSAATGAARKVALDHFSMGNAWLNVSYAPHTFEVDFLAAGNERFLVNVVESVYVDAATITAAKADLNSGDISKYGQRVLLMAEYVGKGWFAVLLGNQIDHRANIPNYILDAIFFGARPSAELWCNILRYRIACIERAGGDAESVAEMRSYVDCFEMELFDFNAVRTHMETICPDDVINAILARF